MNKIVYLYSGIVAVMIAGTAQAQLPANPWDAAAFEEVIEKNNAQNTSETDSSTSTTSDNQTKAKASTSGTSVALRQDIKNDGTSWRGSGQFGKLDYVGEVTTYGDAVGQEMLAPEVNQHNIKVMLDHLRNLGYKIPESYNDKYSNFLTDYKKELQNAYNEVGSNDNPFDKMFSGMLSVFEEGTGLDVENLLFNSINLLSRD